jgi:hypothetical protein
VREKCAVVMPASAAIATRAFSGAGRHGSEEHRVEQAESGETEDETKSDHGSTR